MKIQVGQAVTHRIIFAGSFGVGKTTALRNITEIDVADNDVFSLEVSDAQRKEGKHTTTVGYDYGEIFLEDGSVVSLIGLPGQERFNDVWELLLQSYSGVVLWLAGDSPESLKECARWLEILEQMHATQHLSVVITRVDIPTKDEVLEPYRKLVRHYNSTAPVLSGDPRNREHVMEAVLMTLAHQ